MPRFRHVLQRRFHRDDRGAAMVEFAIIAPLLFLLVFGVIDFGRVFFLYNNLTNAAREGARAGAVLEYPLATTGTTIRDLVRNRIKDSAGSTATVVTTYVGAKPTMTVRVQIQNYPFAPATFLAIKSAKQLNVTAEFRLEQQ